MANDELIPPQMLIVLESLPACAMNFVKAGVRAGYSESYAWKLPATLVREPLLQKALRANMKRLFEQAQESDKLLVEGVLQRNHFRHHPIFGGRPH
jgi:hypothetical protein